MPFSKPSGSSLRSKRSKSSYCTNVRAGAKKKMEGGRGGEKRKRLPANPRFWKTPLDISRAITAECKWDQKPANQAKSTQAPGPDNLHPQVLKE